MHYFDPALAAQQKGYEQFDRHDQISDTKSGTSGNYKTANVSSTAYNTRDKKELDIRKYRSNEPIG